MPHILTFLSKIYDERERKLIHEQLLKGLMTDPRYPVLVIWIREDGAVLNAYGGSIARLGVQKWKEANNNVFKVYPSIEPYIRQCLKTNKPVYFDWVGKGILDKKIWLKCYAIPFAVVDGKFVCGFCFDMSRFGRLKQKPRAVAAEDLAILQIGYGITDRELEALELLVVRSMSPKEISVRTGHSLATVRNHLSRIRRKIGLNSEKISLQGFVRSILQS